MSIYFFTIILAVFFIAYICVGMNASRKTNTLDDYFLMNKKLSLFPLSMTLLAIMFGGVILVGSAQIAYTKSWWVLLYPLGTLLGFVVLSCGFGAKLRKLNLNTMPEIFESVYQSKVLRRSA